MRQGQQNRRGRGRNRKSQNPLTRSFESTGPDVKLRGTANHIAEKYMSLARDAQSSGDPVLAENYMQHAEHYNRIIMSFREQQMSQGGSDPFAGGMNRGPAMAGDAIDGDDFGDDEGDDFGDGRPGGLPGQGLGETQPQMSQPPVHQHQQRSFDQPQRFDNRPQHHRRDHQRPQHNNPRHDRGEGRFDRPDRHDRQDRADRQDFRNDRSDRNGHGEPRGFRDDRQAQAPVSEPAGEQLPRRRERFQNGTPGGESPPAPAHAQQPEFLRRPVRRPRSEPAEDPAPAAPRQVTPEDRE